MIKNITAEELQTRLAKGEVVVVDVREPAEHATECINGACLIPLAAVTAEKLPEGSKPIVIHCRSGKRSEEACKKLLAQDPNLDIYNLVGGITAWKAAGGEIKKSGRNVLPLDRQTQVAAGSLTFIGVMLGLLVHPVFYVIPGFVGLGLMFAGISGWCGMAKLLAKMPWN